MYIVCVCVGFVGRYRCILSEGDKGVHSAGMHFRMQMRRVAIFRRSPRRKNAICPHNSKPNCIICVSATYRHYRSRPRGKMHPRSAKCIQLRMHALMDTDRTPETWAENPTKYTCICYIIYKRFMIDCRDRIFQPPRAIWNYLYN